MIEGHAVVALIPARGGSKGLPGKNIAPLAGRPMIAWTVDAALRSSYVDAVVVSTDDDEIAEAAHAAGAEVPFRRPAVLATDEADSSSVIHHALQELGSAGRRFEYVVLLQPTSPLRTSVDIDEATALCHRRRAPSCVSVCRMDKSPAWIHTLTANGELAAAFPGIPSVTRRQESRPYFALNGAVYVGRTSWLIENGGFLGPGSLGYEMPRARSVDVDDAIDLEVCRLLLGKEQ